MPYLPRPHRCPRARSRPMLMLGLLALVGPLAGCHGSTPPLAELLTAESLPGSPDASGAVEAALAEPEAIEVEEGVAELAAHDAADAMEGAAELRVMSANVRFRTFLDLHNNWPNRRDLFLATVRRFQPDLLGTQESLISQTQDMKAALPEYGYFGAGRNDGETAGEMCGVFYRKDRFQKLDGGHFWLSTEPDRPGSRSWWEPFPRMVTWVKLEPRDGTREPFYFFNTHFAAFSRQARENSAELMRRRVARISNGAPAILAGDFNAEETSDTYDVMRNGLSPDSRTFKDTYRKVHPEPGEHENTIHRFRGTTRGQRIDWILASAPFQTADAAIDRTNYDGRYPSDHFPVQAVLTWPADSETVAAADPSDAAGEASGEPADDS